MAAAQSIIGRRPLRAPLLSLAPKQRAVLLLHFACELSVDECGAALRALVRVSPASGPGTALEWVLRRGRWKRRQRRFGALGGSPAVMAGIGVTMGMSPASSSWTNGGTPARSLRPTRTGAAPLIVRPEGADPLTETEKARSVPAAMIYYPAGRVYAPQVIEPTPSKLLDRVVRELATSRG